MQALTCGHFHIFLSDIKHIKKEINNAIEKPLFQILKPITTGPQDSNVSWTPNVTSCSRAGGRKLFCSAKSSSFKQMGLVVEVGSNFEVIKTESVENFT